MVKRCTGRNSRIFLLWISIYTSKCSVGLSTVKTSSDSDYIMSHVTSDLEDNTLGIIQCMTYLTILSD